MFDIKCFPTLGKKKNEHDTKKKGANKKEPQNQKINKIKISKLNVTPENFIDINDFYEEYKTNGDLGIIVLGTRKNIIKECGVFKIFQCPSLEAFKTNHIVMTYFDNLFNTIFTTQDLVQDCILINETLYVTYTNPIKNHSKEIMGMMFLIKKYNISS
jgi:hypothetical protein